MWPRLPLITLLPKNYLFDRGVANSIHTDKLLNFNLEFPILHSWRNFMLFVQFREDLNQNLGTHLAFLRRKNDGNRILALASKLITI